MSSRRHSARQELRWQSLPGCCWRRPVPPGRSSIPRSCSTGRARRSSTWGARRWPPTAAAGSLPQAPQRAAARVRATVRQRTLGIAAACRQRRSAAVDVPGHRSRQRRPADGRLGTTDRGDPRDRRLQPAVGVDVAGCVRVLAAGRGRPQADRRRQRRLPIAVDGLKRRDVRGLPRGHRPSRPPQLAAQPDASRRSTGGRAGRALRRPELVLGGQHEPLPGPGHAAQPDCRQRAASRGQPQWPGRHRLAGADDRRRRADLGAPALRLTQGQHPRREPRDRRRRARQRRRRCPRGRPQRLRAGHGGVSRAGGRRLALPARSFLNTLPIGVDAGAATFAGAASIDGAANLGAPSVAIDDAGHSRIGYTAAGRARLLTTGTKGVGTPAAIGAASGGATVVSANPDGGGISAWAATDSKTCRQ